MSDIVEAWRQKLAASEKSEDRCEFMARARMCNHFFAGSMGLMWGDKFRSEFLGGMPAPKFKVTIAKAFELVAVMGPSVYWDYPGRVIKLSNQKIVPPEVFGDPEDPSVAERYEEYINQHEHTRKVREAAGMLMEDYLNYSQREQPGGGLQQHSQVAVTESIVKGRGLLWCETYQFPGSDRTLTGCFQDKVENLFLDPDGGRADMTDCRWIARKHCEKYWEVERRFNLPPGSLRHRANKETLSSIEQNNSGRDNMERRNGINQKDLIEWYEIFSKEGIGTRALQHRPKLEQAFDQVIGDYAYLAVAKGVPFPLNFPPAVAHMADDDQAKEAFEWPVPYYKDGRWPVACLDYYRRSDSQWPIAPMSQGLGELVFLNVIISCLMSRTYESCRSIIVGDRSLGDDLVTALKDESFSGFVETTGMQNKDIKNFLTYLESPDLPSGVFAMIDYVSGMFDKRTGLSDLLYGGHSQGKVSRSAADSTLMHETANIRPDWMRRCAENWQTEAANIERIAAGWKVRGEDLTPQIGEQLVPVWNELIADADPELYVRQMRSTLEANSISKPNKFRDNTNIQQTIGYILPILQEYWTMTGDPAPMNNYISSLGAAMEQDTEEWHVPPLPQQPPEGEPPVDPADEERQAVEDAKLQEDLISKQLRNEKLAAETGQAPGGAMPEASPMVQSISPEEEAMLQGMPAEQGGLPGF